jgi:chorismate mutase
MGVMNGEESRNGRHAADEEFQEVRRRIDALDRELVQLIAARCRLARTVGRQKRASGADLVDLGREAAVVRHAASLARAAGIDVETTRRVFWALIEMARVSQGAPPRERGVP